MKQSLDNNVTDRVAELEAKIELLNQQLSLSTESFMNIVGKSRDGILVIGHDGRVLYANPAALKLFNQNLGEMLGSPIGLPMGIDKITEIQIPDNEGGYSTIEMSLAETIWNAKSAKLASLRDVTEKKKAVESLEHMSMHDALTDLPNRVLFKYTLENSIKKAKRNSSHMALLYLDMDGFKRINDSMGHNVGDQYLVETARLLKSCVREIDLVARLGGDEFAIILDDLDKPLNASIVAKKVLDLINKPVAIQGSTFHISFSIGIAVYPLSGDNAQTLIKNADVAMYAAKKAGRHQYKFFSNSLSALSERSALIENNIQHGFSNDEFYLEYQPIICSKTMKVSSVETLLRWNSDELGNVPVVEFLPVLEETGTICKVGEWIIQKCCSDALLHDAKNINLSINVSMQQLHDDTVVDSLIECILATQFPPEQIILEITESMIMHDPDSIIKRLCRITDTGIKLAIDDFGTGYSSLAYLKQLPVHQLKVDRSFVRDITSDQNDAVIVKSIISLGHTLGLAVVAEGVETQGQMDILMANDCDYLQGHLFCRPVDFVSAIKFDKDENGENSS